MTTTTSPGITPSRSKTLQGKVMALIAGKTFCTIATTSPAGRPHNSGVVYEHANGTLWFHTSRDSRKARNIAQNPYVGLCIPYRRLPVGPPFTIHFQAQAEIFETNSAEIVQQLDQGHLASISKHGALDMTHGCFVAVRPQGTIHSYGPGTKTIDLIRDPLNNGAHSFPLP